MLHHLGHAHRSLGHAHFRGVFWGRGLASTCVHLQFKQQKKIKVLRWSSHFPSRVLSSEATGSIEYFSGMAFPSGRPRWLIRTTDFAPWSRQYWMLGTAALILRTVQINRQLSHYGSLWLIFELKYRKSLTSGCWWCVCPSWERWSQLWNRTVTVITLFWHISCRLLCIYRNNWKCFNQVFQLAPLRKSSCYASKSCVKLEAWGQTRPAKAF